jgi:NADPH:quinone reductase-like Zn-dependent oxidoreductase
MLVMQLDGYGAALRAVEHPEPRPGPGQVRIRTAAATVNPVDWLTADGVLAAMTPHLAPPFVLGWDVAGTVDAVGDGAPYAVGQAVAGMSPWFARGVGTFAEAVVLDADQVAPVPDGLDLAEAATVPLNGQTARQALDLADVRPGRTLLVTGASGAVGGFAVQLAAREGVEVVAVASTGDEERVRSLGAAQVLPRTAAPDELAAAVRRARPDGVDAVLDAVPVGPPLIAAVRDGGTFVTVLDPAVPAAERGVRVAKVSVSPDPRQLAALLADVEAGRLVSTVAKQFPLADAPEAFAVAARGGLRGKVVLVP